MDIPLINKQIIKELNSKDLFDKAIQYLKFYYLEVTEKKIENFNYDGDFHNCFFALRVLEGQLKANQQLGTDEYSVSIKHNLDKIAERIPNEFWDYCNSYHKLYFGADTNSFYNAPSEVIWENEKFGSFIDQRDGEKYKVVKIGEQIWMQENLRATKLNYGKEIPNIHNRDWGSSKYRRYCWYNDDIQNKPIYGALYNWNAVNSGYLAPKGWHIPTNEEWIKMLEYMGLEKELIKLNRVEFNNIGSKLKSTTGWILSENNTNESGFSALPGGFRFTFGFVYGGEEGYWWSSTLTPKGESFYLKIEFDNDSIEIYPAFVLDGFSVRCVKD